MSELQQRIEDYILWQFAHNYRVGCDRENAPTLTSDESLDLMHKIKSKFSLTLDDAERQVKGAEYSSRVFDFSNSCGLYNFILLPKRK